MIGVSDLRAKNEESVPYTSVSSKILSSAAALTLIAPKTAHVEMSNMIKPFNLSHAHTTHRVLSTSDESQALTFIFGARVTLLIALKQRTKIDSCLYQMNTESGHNTVTQNAKFFMS